MVDTNIIVSGIISPNGVPSQILRALRARKAILLVSDPIVQEYLEVLEYPHIKKYKQINEESLRDLTCFFIFQTERVELLTEIRKSPDPDDNVFLSTAVNGKADFLITEDKNDLLSLKEIDGIPIVSARNSLKFFA